MNNNYINTNFETRKTQLTDQVPPLVDKYLKYYPYINSANEENKRIIDECSYQIQQIYSGFVNLEKDINVAIEKMNNDMASYNKRIQTSKYKLNEIDDNLTNLENENMGAESRIYDFRGMYRYNYVVNASLLGCMFLLSLNLK
jgi:uncharacterized protein (DUF2344 family)